MKRKLISLAVVLLLSIAIVVPVAFAAPIDTIMSDAAFTKYYDEANAVVLPYEDGAKAAVAIPSNAHYADYADEGFWFIWNAKQKDEGFAVVADFFFDNYESVTITVKSSNVYKNVTITEAGTYSVNKFLLKNEKKGEAGGYHNINWIGVGLKAREEEVKPAGQKVGVMKCVDGIPFANWAAELEVYGIEFSDIADGMTFRLYATENGVIVGDCLEVANVNLSSTIAFAKEYPAGWYAITEELSGLAAEIFKEVSEPMFFYVSEQGVQLAGAKISVVSKGGVGGVVAVNEIPAQYAPEQITDKWNYGIGNVPNGANADKFAGAQWVWDVENPSATHGVTGSVITADYEFYIGGAILDDEVWFYYACDNAAVVYVNGQFAGNTYEAMRGVYNEDIFANLDSTAFDGSNWYKVYEINIKEFLKDGYNTITVIAANSSQDNGANSSYNEKNNPGGLIFACNINVEGFAFNNYTVDDFGFAKLSSYMEEEPVIVNVGFIGYYEYNGKILSTSIHWQQLSSELDTIDWDAVDAAYAAWVAKGGLAPDRSQWHTSGYAPLAFDDYAVIAYGDLTVAQMEAYYLTYYISPVIPR